MNNKNNKPSLSMSYAGTDYVALTDICQPKQWKTIPKAELKATGYPVYGANGIIGYSDEYNHENKTILIACRGASCGAVNVCLPKSYVTGNAMCLDNLSEEFDLDFLQHYLQTYDFKKAISGSAQPQITRSGLNSVMVPILPTSLQRRISHVLNAVDKNKKQTEQAINYLDSLIKSRFIEMFGALEPSVSISDACIEFIDGDWIESKDQSESGIRLIQTGNIGNGAFRDKRNRARYISEQTFEQLKCHEVYGGDVLISRLPDPVGRACIVPSDAGRSITAVDCSIVRLKKEWEPTFFVSYTMTEQYERQIQSYLTGTTRKRISRSNLGRIKIPAASSSLQQEFAAFVSQVDKLRFAAQQQIDKLELLKKSLLQEYFN